MSKDNDLFDNKNHAKIDSHGSFLSEYSILNEKMISIFEQSFFIYFLNFGHSDGWQQGMADVYVCFLQTSFTLI